MATRFLRHTRNLQRIYAPEHGLWVFVWSHDDGDLDANHRLCYSVVASPGEFKPSEGQFVVVQNLGSTTPTWVYGVPYSISNSKGAIKVYYQDLNVALGWPTQTSQDTTSYDLAGKDPESGNMLEGHFIPTSSINGPMVWGIVEDSFHNLPGTMLEVTDTGTFDQGSGDGCAAPTGTLVVEYERDKAGRIILDGSGKPYIKQIDDKRGFVAQNYKLGYLGLEFVENYFGLGLHGWISSSKSEHPFQVIQVAPKNDGTPQIGVISNSHIFNSEDLDTYEEDNTEWGLLSDDKTSGGFDVPELGEKIWLQIHLDADQSIAAVDIKHGSVGSEVWDEFPDPISINSEDTPYQEYYNQLIAEVTDPEKDPRPGFRISVNGESRQITQVLFTNLLFTTAVTNEDADEPNLPLIVPIPFQGIATKNDGSADPIANTTDIMTPWRFGPRARLNPFSLYDASTATAKVLGITNGLVSGPLDSGVSQLPTGMTAGGDPPYEQPVADGDKFAYLVLSWTVSASSATVNSITIDSGTTVPVNAATTQYVSLGDFDASGSALQITMAEGIGNIEVYSCRNWFSNPATYTFHVHSY